MRRVGMVSLDALASHRLDLDLEEHENVARILAAEGCDVLVHSLQPDDRSTIEEVYAGFGVVAFGTTAVNKVFLLARGKEVVDSPVLTGLAAEVVANAHVLIKRLGERSHDGNLVLAGSELNIVRMVKRSGYEFVPPVGLLPGLVDHGIHTILSPTSTYMRRWEMKLKRQYLSQEGRAVLSVWNKTGAGESQHPWTAFIDGQQVGVRTVQGHGMEAVEIGVVEW